ncbi:MAG TPA: hypothetical protein PKC43_07415 [Phycisphaerales bacterium]|nr:hypothetical protein [Phycisphaerales bacterium]HMP37263.1 hypothetical protein [Phycisphaerales bacterium]
MSPHVSSAVAAAATIERILRGGLHLQPLPGDAPSASPAGRDFGRALRECDALLELAEVA